METITLKEVKMKIETEVVNKKEYLLVILSKIEQKLSCFI
ncbi:hypothetical protein MPTP_1932 (plasmid) [Melissococcus plutonius ATCC 35311]|uniref:Uncharacterized protein n=1 Tax=Melissococcus plutonius (strain ATCC 35311 / DSM 29964 / CIP 104052 / LMG 20360 / NCIMB 702443) TaxID=940190 RepID=F3YCU4_MELPT|nr:hypothetical protein MPTP_1932 [Melissococcus plutonius ATCC 35311]BBD15997.1 hypothetical protein DAT585_p1064 [Melissococcus plutonius]BBD17623.1 hypothetical protein DAT606_p1067 [Melissococcus plutonius]BBP08178.1 hypothetical protein DAT1033_p1067 [Melissococcus plutonius]